MSCSSGPPALYHIRTSPRPPITPTVNSLQPYTTSIFTSTFPSSPIPHPHFPPALYHIHISLQPYTTSIRIPLSIHRFAPVLSCLLHLYSVPALFNDKFVSCSGFHPHFRPPTPVYIHYIYHTVVCCPSVHSHF